MDPYRLLYVIPTYGEMNSETWMQGNIISTIT